MGEFLKERAEEFLDEAEELLKKGRFGLSAFHFEQEAQLFIKYYIYLKLGDFPKTHLLKNLLIEPGKTYQKEDKVKQFMDENISVISDLEVAYISSGYLPSKFIQSQIEQMRKFVTKLLQFLSTL